MQETVAEAGLVIHPDQVPQGASARRSLLSSCITAVLGRED